MISNGRIFWIVYGAFVLDNVLMTAIVPIIPTFLYDTEYGGREDLREKGPRHHILLKESGRIGYLFASKAIVQLPTNFLVGKLTTKFGFRIPFVMGSVIILISSSIFAMSSTFEWFLLARSLHGVGSSCFSVPGMGMLAKNYDDDKERSKIISQIMGGVALGISLGYPVGGAMYNAFGKTPPFVIITIAAFFFMAFLIKDLRRNHDNTASFDAESEEEADSIFSLLRDKRVLIIVGSIWMSASSVSILEPCLPLWLMDTIHPEKWQVGATFISDSVGYLLGTTFFGIISYKVGRYRMGMIAGALVGVGCFLVPFAKSMTALIIPQFLLGLGVGLMDSAMMPLLARITDLRCGSREYGLTYAAGETAVSLAYGISPLIGSRFVEILGFSKILSLVGLGNLLYIPLLRALKDD